MKKRRKQRKIRKFFKQLGTLNIVLICVFAYLVVINWQMLDVYRTYGSAPESAWCALIAALIGECGICGWIRTNKDKQQDRQYEKESMARDAPGHNPGSVPVNENDPPEEDTGEDEMEGEE